jgi:hypothetical protein
VRPADRSVSFFALLGGVGLTGRMNGSHEGLLVAPVDHKPANELGQIDDNGRKACPDGDRARLEFSTRHGSHVPLGT